MILTCFLVMIGGHYHVQCVKVISMAWRRVLRTPLPLLEGVPQVFLCENGITRNNSNFGHMMKNHEKLIILKSAQEPSGDV